MQNSKLLLHTCCAPCASASVERLLSEGWEVVLYFYMPNIFPYEEFETRLEAVKKLAAHFSLELHVGDYSHTNWLQKIKGNESAPEGGIRCFTCFDVLLHGAYVKAQELGIESFATSLTISPHKNSEKIREIGQQYFGYVHYDFKKKNGYKRSIEMSKELGLYRQCYCACEFSMKRLQKTEEVNSNISESNPQCV